MSAKAGTTVSVTRASVSGSGSEPSATPPTALSSPSRSDRPTLRARTSAPPTASSEPSAITTIRTACSESPVPLFQSGLAAAAATAAEADEAVPSGPANSAATNGAAT